MNNARHFTLITVLLTLSACVSIKPLPIYQLEPINEEPKWLNGQAFMIREDSAQIVIVGFYRSEEANLLFDIEVVNQSNDAILIDPQLFYIKSGNENGATVFALNPEKALLSLDIAYAKEKAAYKTKETNDALWSLADVLVGVADNAAAIGEKGTPQDAEARRQRNQEREERLSRYEIRSQNREYAFNSTTEKIRNSRDAIENTFLRKTTLAKGFRATGRVAFPVIKGSGAFQVVLPIEGREHIFWFRQREIHVGGQATSVKSEEDVE